MPKALPSLFLLPWLACAGDLAPGKKTDAAVNNGDGGLALPVMTRAVGAGFETLLDASWPDDWVYFDFETSQSVAASGPWDLAFQRFKVRSNGGISGTSGAEVAVLEDRGLDAVTQAPDSGWRVDQPDGEDMNSDFDTVFNAGEDTWFAYDTSIHILAPKNRVYVVRTGDDHYYAVAMQSYYDQIGNAGFLQFGWKTLTAPGMRTPATPVPDGAAGSDARHDGGGNGGDGSGADAGTID